MKRVTMRTLMAGPRGIAHPGQTIELNDGQAKLLIDAGHAEEAIEPQGEIATAGPLETATAAAPARTAVKK